MARKNIVAVDIGNSRIKFFRDNEFISFELDKVHFSNVENYLELFAGEDLTFVIASVNQALKNKIANSLKSLGIDNIFASELLSEQEIIDFSGIEGMGEDRKLGLIGALNETAPPLITVDCGTAVTVNALDKENKCLGGAIFAGFYTQTEALSEKSDALPKILPRKISYASAKTTDEALNAGIVLGTAGAIKEIVERIDRRHFNGARCDVVLTGGYSELIAEYLENWKHNVIENRHLVLKGIIRAAAKLGISK